ncbi:MAG: hypothetical protein RJS97_16415 [Parvibaculaceae bacterium]
MRSTIKKDIENDSQERNQGALKASDHKENWGEAKNGIENAYE